MAELVVCGCGRAYEAEGPDARCPGCGRAWTESNGKRLGRGAGSGGSWPWGCSAGSSCSPWSCPRCARPASRRGGRSAKKT